MSTLYRFQSNVTHLISEMSIYIPCEEIVQRDWSISFTNGSVEARYIAHRVKPSVKIALCVENDLLTHLWLLMNFFKSALWRTISDAFRTRKFKLRRSSWLSDWWKLHGQKIIRGCQSWLMTCGEFCYCSSWNDKYISKLLFWIPDGTLLLEQNLPLNELMKHKKATVHDCPGT